VWYNASSVFAKNCCLSPEIKLTLSGETQTFIPIVTWAITGFELWTTDNPPQELPGQASLYLNEAQILNVPPPQDGEENFPVLSIVALESIYSFNLTSPISTLLLPFVSRYKGSAGSQLVLPFKSINLTGADWNEVNGFPK